MRLETTKVTMKQEEGEDELSDLQRKLNNCSLIEPKKEKIKLEPKEEQEEPKKELKEEQEEPEVETVTQALNDLSVVSGEKDDDRVERGPIPKQHDPRPAPYSSHQKHLSGGTVIEVNRNSLADNNFNVTAALTLNQSLTYFPQPLTPPLDCSPLQTSTVDFENIFTEAEYLDVVKYLTDVGVQQVELQLDSDICSQTSPPMTIHSPSSGYESGTSSPTNSPSQQSLLSPQSLSPPRSDESSIPESIQVVNNQKPVFRPILPKQNLESGLQRELYEYIVNLSTDRDGNMGIFKRNEHIFFNLNSVERLAKKDSNGDTMLMIYISNKNSAKPLATKLGYSQTQETVFRLSSIYNLVARFSMEFPAALEAKNDLQQSVLHLAARNCAEHPLVAAFIAEKLQQHKFNFAEKCTATYCEMNGCNGNLLHCLARQGDTHSEVLRHLLKLKGMLDLIDSNCVQESLLLTPLHLAIKAHTCYNTVAVATVQVLLQHNARVSKNLSKSQDSAMHFALTGTPSQEIVELLLSKKNASEANVLDLDGNHPLLNLLLSSKKISEEKFFQLLQLLISKGATIKKVPNIEKFFEELHNQFRDEVLANKVHKLFFL